MKVGALAVVSLLGAALVHCGHADGGGPTSRSEKPNTLTSALTAEQCSYFEQSGSTTICHATTSAKNPYVLIKVSESACVNAHASHPHDFIDVDAGDCRGAACLPETAPCDPTLPCCGNLTCNGGTCQCPFGQAFCEGEASCVDVTSDPANCGGCGVVCTAGATCANGTCVNVATCTDGLKNGTEADVDCGGGACPACATGRSCVTSTDCITSFCDPATETCGVVASCGSGANPPAAASGSISAVSGSSLSNGETFTIADGVHPPTVFEFAQSGTVATGHVAVDIGATDSAINVAARMANAINSVGDGLDVTATASGMMVLLVNNRETSLGNVALTGTVGDPGFALSGMAGGAGGDCPTGAACGSNADCVPGLACSGGICASTSVASTCTDGLKNGTETDVDCGGGACPACVTGQSCVTSSDCTTSLCDPTTETCGAVPSCDGSGASPPAAATGSISMVGGDGLLDGDTFTISDGVHPPTVFEFDKSGSVAIGHVAVSIGAAAPASTVAAFTAVAINSVGDTLGVTATASGTVVSLLNDLQTSLGNVALTDTVAAAGFAVSGMSGGAGGDCPVGTACGSSADCVPGLVCGAGTCQP